MEWPGGRLNESPSEKEGKSQKLISGDEPSGLNEGLR